MTNYEQRPIRMGIMGTAAIATRSIIPALQRMPNRFELYAVASRSLAKAEAEAQLHGIQAYGSYEALLNDPNVEAVYIPLPNALHREWVLRALEAGKHVLCEKSLGTSLEEVNEMVEAAKTRHLALVENFQFRFHDQLRTLKSYLGMDGAVSRIGALRTVRCSFGFPPFADQENIRYSRELGGGALLDAGAYMTKIVHILLGDQAELQGAALVYDPAMGVDLHGSGTFVEPQTGLTAHVAFGFDHFYQCGVEVWGTQGRLRTNRLFTARADFSPVFELETASAGLHTVSLPPDDHFVNMLNYFGTLCVPEQEAHRMKEYSENLRQAAMLQDFRDKALITYESKDEDNEK